MAATDHQVDSAICGAFTLLWGEKTASWPQTFNTALNKLGGKWGWGEGRAQDSGLFYLMKTLLLRHCVPFGPAKVDTVGIQFRRWP